MGSSRSIPFHWIDHEPILLDERGCPIPPKLVDLQLLGGVSRREGVYFANQNRILKVVGDRIGSSAIACTKDAKGELLETISYTTSGRKPRVFYSGIVRIYWKPSFLESINLIEKSQHTILSFGPTFGPVSYLGRAKLLKLHPVLAEWYWSQFPMGRLYLDTLHLPKGVLDIVWAYYC